MYLLYVDESGRSQLGSDGTHFVLLGLAIHASTWKQKVDQIAEIKTKYGLEGKEIHTGWMARRYIEQEKINGFESLDYTTRRKEVEKERNKNLRIKAMIEPTKKVRSIKKNYDKTIDYIHLTLTERKAILTDLAKLIGTWTDSRLFGEAIDKTSFRANRSLFEQGFTQVVSRFEGFLQNYGRYVGGKFLGLIIQDDNETEAQQLTDLMKKFHREGTFWREINQIVETPLFVDSQLTDMVQMADLCAYATRRFFEKSETYLFDEIYNIFDRIGSTIVGLRHFTEPMNSCNCRVCREHRTQ